MKIRNTLLVVAIGMLLASCSPVFYYLPFQKLEQSRSGLFLVDKSLAVVSADSSEFSMAYATHFAHILGEDYLTDVQVYSLESEDANESLKQKMVDFVVSSGKDVVFFIEKLDLELDLASEAAFPGRTLSSNCHIRVYDSFDPADSVYFFKSTPSFTVPRKDESLINNVTLDIARQTSSRFSPEIVTEEIPFAYYEEIDRWIEPLEKIVSLKTDDAIKEWTRMLNTKNVADKAALELNIASALYIEGRYDLSREWLELSKKTFNIAETSVLERKLKKVSK